KGHGRRCGRAAGRTRARAVRRETTKELILRNFIPATRPMDSFEPLNLVGTARCAVRAAFSHATMPPAASRAGTSQRDAPTEVRFIGVRSGTCVRLALAAGCCPMDRI